MKSPNSVRLFHSNCHSWRCILLPAPDYSRLPPLHRDDLRHQGRARSGSHPLPRPPRNPDPQRPSILHARSPRSGARTFSPRARCSAHQTCSLRPRRRGPAWLPARRPAHSNRGWEDPLAPPLNHQAPPRPIPAAGFCGPALCAKPRPQPSARCSRPRNCGCGSERVRGQLGLSELEG